MSRLVLAVTLLAVFAVSSAAAMSLLDPVVGLNAAHHHHEVDFTHRRAHAARAAVRAGRLPRMPRFELSDYASVALLLHQSLVTKIADHSAPFLEHIATTTAIPAQDTDHYSFPSFFLKNFTLGAAVVNFIAPDQIQATFSNVSVVVPETPFYVYEKIFGHKIGCHGTFGAVVNNTWLQLTLTVIRSPLNGTMLVSQSSAQARFGHLTISHTFDSDICKIAGAVIGFFFGGLNNLLKDLVEDFLPPKIAHIAMNKTNEEMDSSPLRLASPPNVTSTGFELVAELIPSNSTPPSLAPPSFDAFPPRDIEFYLTEQSLNSFLAIKTADGSLSGTWPLPASINTSSIKKVVPGADKLCHGCPLQASFTAMAPPYAVIGGASVAVSVSQFQVAVAAINASTPVDLMTVAINLGLSVDNITVTGDYMDTIDFKVHLPTLSATVVQTAVGNINIPLLVGLLKFVLSDLVLKDFNDHFAGVTLPDVDGFNTTKLVLAISNGQLAVAADVDVPSSF